MEDAVIETVDQVDTGVDTSVDTSQEPQPDDPYSSKASREYSQWLKEMREVAKDDPKAAKFLRLSKDNHARLYQLQQMEQRGLDGVREKYAALDSVMHGELKGIEAVNALQDELRGVQEIDERLLSGDANALKEMGDEFVAQALPKLAGPILEMVRQSNPEAYAAAMLPHFVDALKSSDLVTNHNAIVDILNERPPDWLPKEREAAWWADRDKRMTDRIGANSTWLNAQAKRAGELPKASGQAAKTEPSEVDTLRKDAETQHWDTNIQPIVDKYADSTFDKLFRPYEKRLRLSAAAKSDLKEAWIGESPKNGRPGRGVIGESFKNKSYTDQLNRYHGQRKPNANTVTNFVKVEWDKHAENVFKKLVDTRYKSFLAGKPAAQQQTNGTKKPVAPGVQIVTVKPTNIDHKNTPLQWLHDKKYRLTDGKVVQLQR